QPQLLRICSDNCERFCSTCYARRLKNESVCDSCDNPLIGSACPRSGRPREGRGEQGGGAEEERVRTDRESVQGNAQEDDSRTTCQENRPVGKFTLVFLRAPVRAPTATCPVRTLRSTSQPSDASATR